MMGPQTQRSINSSNRLANCMGEAFVAKLDYYGKAWLPARDIVENALSNRFSLDEYGRILHLPTFCPWKVISVGGYVR